GLWVASGSSSGGRLGGESNTGILSKESTLTMDMKNIFSGIKNQSPEEIFETIIKTNQFKIERIISNGQSTDKGKWYDQDKNEWVILLKGSAGLIFEDNHKVITMKPGDYVNIPAHKKHRVERTDPEGETIWLAVHY
ncbi:MAG: cupin domain-containing protein, partial [Candidatus Scalindua sp.]